MPSNTPVYEYDVALSFAGEHRERVKQLADLLKEAGLTVFYDDWEQAELWGSDLVQHLDDVYSRKALFCVIFISAEYVEKAWTRHELKSAQARAFRDKTGYILPLRLDDTTVPGIRETTGFIDLRKRTIEDVAQFVSKKVASAKGGAKGSTTKATADEDAGPTKAASASAAKVAPVAPRASNLQLKKKFTEQDHDTFLEEAYEFIGNYFEQSLAGLKAENEGVDGKFRRINSNHFTAIIYRDGRKAAECGIRLGGAFGNQISFSYEASSTNSMNEAVRVDDDGKVMFLKANGFASFFGRSGKQKDRLTPEDAAELFWGMLVERLQ